MRINKLTITGFDDIHQLPKLYELSEKYPFVEWGILFSKERAGTPRFLHEGDIYSMAAINRSQLYDKRLNLSLHICGAQAKEILSGQFGWVEVFGDFFKRIQINHRYDPKFNYEYDLLRHVFYSCKKRNQFILQANENNLPLLEKLVDYSDDSAFAILHDSSGGQNRLIQTVSRIPGFLYQGFSGGISPDNFESLFTVEKSVYIGSTDSTTWIDLESGVRTDNKFDFEKVERMLEIFSKYYGRVLNFNG